MQICPIPASRSASASSTLRTITIRDALFARATAAVVKARNTSMTATEPVARVAPARRLWIEVSITTDTMPFIEPVKITLASQLYHIVDHVSVSYEGGF